LDRLTCWTQFGQEMIGPAVGHSGSSMSRELEWERVCTDDNWPDIDVGGLFMFQTDIKLITKVTVSPLASTVVSFGNLFISFSRINELLVEAHEKKTHSIASITTLSTTPDPSCWKPAS
jgi:hypothetical protein